jgi:hypothetical protein
MISFQGLHSTPAKPTSTTSQNTFKGIKQENNQKIKSEIAFKSQPAQDTVVFAGPLTQNR